MSQTDYSNAAGAGRLAGVTMVELAGIGPTPYCGQLLAQILIEGGASGRCRMTQYWAGGMPRREEETCL